MLIPLSTSYFLYSNFNDTETVELSIICRSDVYSSCPLNLSNKPPSRKNQSWGDYIKDFKCATTTQNTLLFEYEINHDEINKSIILTIKQLPRGGSTTKTLLYRDVFDRKVEASIFDTLLLNTTKLLQAQQSEIEILKKIGTDNLQTIASLTEDIRNSIIFKNSLSNESIRKFMLILNAKKRRIAELESKDTTLPIVTWNIIDSKSLSTSIKPSKKTSFDDKTVNVHELSEHDNDNDNDSHTDSNKNERDKLQRSSRKRHDRSIEDCSQDSDESFEPHAKRQQRRNAAISVTTRVTTRSCNEGAFGTCTLDNTVHNETTQSIPAAGANLLESQARSHIGSSSVGGGPVKKKRSLFDDSSSDRDS